MASVGKYTVAKIFGAGFSLGVATTMFLYNSSFFMLTKDHDEKYILKAALADKYVERKGFDEVKAELDIAKRGQKTELKNTELLRHELVGCTTTNKKNEKMLSDVSLLYYEAKELCDKQRADKIKECLDRNPPEHSLSDRPTMSPVDCAIEYEQIYVKKHSPNKPQ